MPTATKNKGAKASRKDTGKGQVLVTTACFDTRSPILRFAHQRQPIGEVQPFGPEHYLPAGGTPLNDATLAMIRELEAARKRKPDAVHIGMLMDESGSMSGNRQAVIDGVNEFIGALRGEKPKGKGRTLCVILTDGIENSSEATTDAVRAEISKREDDEELDWTFIYLGANQDAWHQGGGARGTSVSANFASTPAGTTSALRSGSGAVANYVGDYGAMSKHSRSSLMNTELRTSLGDTGNDEGNSVQPGASFAVTNSTFNIGSAIDQAKDKKKEE